MEGLIVLLLFAVLLFFLVRWLAGFSRKAVHKFYENLQEKYELPEKKGRVKNLLKVVQEEVIEVLENQNAELQESLPKLEKQIEKLQPLLKYQFIQDAEAEAQRIVQEANEQYNNAEKESERILAEAKEEAKALAGNALDAKENADAYKKTAKAMKNIIEGYGDEYLIPNHSVLDELAEAFSHKEAGVALKEAREQSRTLIKKGKATDCDYKDEERRKTAIHFVLDAFNGKTDSILSKVKHDNLGKLEQEIKDAHSLVNLHGQAFRNARVLPQYLDARLEELQWAVRTHELKLQEREEQRRIKEAMREEEKARREYEKALKDAEKEEKMLQKAMEEARRQLGEATAEQKQKYEQELLQLQEQLAEAETKNQRALSMAQQTKTGHIYVISNVGSFGEQVYKIGMTRRLDPLDRVKELGDASVPFEFDVHAMIHTEDAPTLEKELHDNFGMERVNKSNPRKEFFKINLQNIRKLIEKKGIHAHWTMTAEAREYRESLALENQAHREERLAG